MTHRLFRVVGVRRDRLHDFIDADSPAAAVEQYAQRHAAGGYKPEVVQPCDDLGADAGERLRVRGKCEICGRVIFDDDEYLNEGLLLCADCVIAASSAKAVAS